LIIEVSGAGCIDELARFTVLLSASKDSFTLSKHMPDQHNTILKQSWGNIGCWFNYVEVNMKIFFWRKKRRNYSGLLWGLLLIPVSAVGSIFYVIRNRKFQAEGNENQPKEAKQAVHKNPRARSHMVTDARREKSSGKEQEKDRSGKEGSQSLEVIEGIGPKTAEILRSHGIKTLSKLADTSVDRLNQILKEAGLRISPPDTWPEQARLAAEGRWDEFERLTGKLHAGRRTK
jgi:predicted flap endonuclease-1-like 5' DNA nuclease